MDWDDEVYSREDLTGNLHQLGVDLGDGGVDELLTRTTKNTRSGNEFGFKPTSLSIGIIKESNFYSGWTSQVEREGDSPFSEERLPSSFWIRFREEWFQIRAFCSQQSESRRFRPYECRIPFRDVVPGGVQLCAQYPWGEDQRVLAHLFIRSRRPASYSYYLERVVKVGSLAVFERHATEADFFPMSEFAAERDAGPISAVADDPRLLIRPGLWLVHRLEFAITLRQYKLLWMCMIRLRLIAIDADIRVATLPSMYMPKLTLPENWDFEGRYLVEGLLCHGIVTVPEVPELLAAIAAYRPNLRASILEGLFKWTRRKSIWNDIRDVARRVTPFAKHSEHFVQIRRCLITPTRCLLNPPALETSNALLRAHQDYEDRFIRVQFVDDDGDFPVTGESLIIDSELQGTNGVFARMRRALTYGLKIAGRSYTFLTFGESQIREHGCWMISECGDFTVANVVAWMGDLSREGIVAKHAARQGLTLSTTRRLPLDDIPLKIVKIDDISRNGYTFTDGSGQCSQRLIDRCARLFGYHSSSVVHGRIGGIKGVWHAAVPAEDQIMDEHEIRVRDSQVKFQSPHEELSVIKVASYSRATLNRQAILLLESLGVPTDTLLDIFRDEKTKIEMMETTFVQRNLATLSTFPIAGALQAHISGDPLQENVMRVIKCRRLSDLKWKAWIDLEESAFLMGVADDTDSLEEGQVFCQLQPPGGSAKIVAGRCTIYRNPCLHPGDIRPVNAVDCPRLTHLKNVIVFSTRGYRDLPNMLAGGDLDGDFYSLLWDPRLQISDENVYKPMDYTAPRPNLSPTPITIEQTKKHFVDFVKNDVLGRICNAHMALADTYGPQDAQCIDLARLASRAVDFSKTGIAVSLRDIPLISEYPDFMGKEYKSIRAFKKQTIKSYESMKALGLMFREIDPEPEFHEIENYTGDPELCALELPTEWTEYLDKVALFKARYDFQLIGLLRRYKITEAECVAGVLLRSPKTRLRVEKDFDLRVAVREAYSILTSSAISQANEYLGDHSLTGSAELDRRAWALAAYNLTHKPDLAEYEPNWDFIDDGLIEDDVDELGIPERLSDQGLWGKRFLSYPWLFSKDLFILKRGVGS